MVFSGSTVQPAPGGLAPAPPASPLTGSTPALVAWGAGLGRNRERSGRRGAFGRGPLRAGGRSGATVEAVAVPRGERGCRGLDRNARQLSKGHARRRERVADALFELRVASVEAGLDLAPAGGGAARVAIDTQRWGVGGN